MSSDFSPDDGSPRGRRLRDVGGTSGGMGEFLVGVALMAVGAWLLLGRVVVTSGWSSLAGRSTFSLALLPLFFGVVILFFRGGSRIGWSLLALSLLGIFATIVSDLHVFFRPTSLGHTLLMFAAMAAGAGFVFRAILPHDRD